MTTSDSPYDADIVIVGSGFGGAVAALRLAEAGQRVIVLERGRRLERDGFRVGADQMWDPEKQRFGPHDMRAAGPIIQPWRGSGVGGGSLVYAGALVRLEDFSAYPGISAAQMAPYYDTAEEMLGSTPYPPYAPYGNVRIVEHHLEVGQELSRTSALVEDAGPLNMGISFAPCRPGLAGTSFTNQHGAQQRYTDPLETALAGGDIETKNSLDRNYLYLAERHPTHPIEIRTLHEATQIAPDSDGYVISFVQYDDEAPKPGLLARLFRRGSPPAVRTGTIRAQRVVVAAGAIGSTELLLRSSSKLPAINHDALGTRYSTNGDYLMMMIPRLGLLLPWATFFTALGLLLAGALSDAKLWWSIPAIVAYYGSLAFTGRPFSLDVGNSNSTFIRFVGRQGEPQGVYIQGGRFLSPKALIAWALSALGVYRPSNYRLLNRLGRMAEWVIPPLGALARTTPIALATMGRDDTTGTIELDPVTDRAVIHFEPKANEEYYEHIRRLGKLVARRSAAFWLPHLLYRLRRQLQVPHNQGGVPMGYSKADGVVDHAGRVFGAPNLMVLDGSIMPESPGPNPSLTILALAERALQQITAQIRQNGPVVAQALPRGGPGPTPPLEPLPPSICWRAFLHTRTLDPDRARPDWQQRSQPTTLAEALQDLAVAARGGGVGTLRQGHTDWRVFRYFAGTRLGRPRLERIVIANVASPTLVADGEGELGVAAPGKSVTPEALGFGVVDLELEAATQSAAAQIRHEQLRRALAGARLLPITRTGRLLNHGKNESWTPSLSFRPGTELSELTDLLETLRRIGSDAGQPIKVKAGGSRHSWSRAAASDEMYIHPERMSGVGALNDDTQALALLKQDRPLDHYYCVLAGTTIKTINEELWQQGHALPVLGGFDGQTIAGVLGTGTHGSVLGSGPIHDAVRAIVLVLHDGSVLRIEPTNGISSDPAPGAAPWRLKQDDDLFNAALVSVGAFGVFHSLVLEVVDKFYLREKRTEHTLTEIRTLLRGGNIYHLTNAPAPAWVPASDGRVLKDHPGNVYHLEFLINPHPTEGDHTVIVTSRAIFSPDPIDLDEYAKPRSGNRNLFRVLSRDDRFTRPPLSTWTTERWGSVIATVTTLFAGSRKGMPKLLDVALGALADKEYAGRSHDVFNIGDGQNRIPALSSEPSVRLEGDKYLTALDLILDHAAQAARRGEMHTGPISLRFVRGSNAHLADPVDVCRFELIFTARTKHAPKLMREYEDLLVDQFPDDARLHWGQINNLNARTAERLTSMYPKLKEWREFCQDLDPDGVFSNAWQDSTLRR